MDLAKKMLNPYEPLVLFEMVPPAADQAGAIEAAIEQAGKVEPRIDAINLPEIHDETRNEARSATFVPRMEPRRLGSRIQRELGVEVIINRCVVHDENPIAWFRETHQDYGLRHAILVGGESSATRYRGPGVVEAAGLLGASGLGTTLGGISIPSRINEAERVRRKVEAGLSFFTTQVLFDSNDIVWLLQRLNGVEARIFLSFAPVSDPRDLKFLRWLGADIPADLDRYLLSGSSADGGDAPSHGRGQSCLDRSLDLCRRILMDVFDNLPPDPPLIGLNVEHINKRNLTPAAQMVEKLGELYTHLISARASS
ncbi:MAG: hypothetical protein ACRD3D_14080 [Terriglobia bacterium]